MRRWHRRSARPERLAALALALAGCANLGTRGEPPAGSVGVYQRLAVVALLTDDLRLAPVGTSDGKTLQAGWDTPRLAGVIVQEMLGPAGTEVAILPAPMPDAATLEGPGWPQAAWQQARGTGTPAGDALAGTQAVLVLRERAISRMGMEYSPAANFLFGGVIGLAAGAARQDEEFRRAFVVRQNTGLDEAIGGKDPTCLVGLDARVLDATTGSPLGAADGLLGQQQRPEALASPLEITDAEREATRPYCLAALRRAIAEAVSTLRLTRAP